MRIIDLRDWLVLSVLSLYLLFNHGFMQIRLPLGGGFAIPTGELLLACFLLALSSYRWLPRLSRMTFILPFALWWGFEIGRVLIAIPEYGVWALRDGTHVIESLYLWVGFVVASRPKLIERLYWWLPRLLGVACLYGLTYPFATDLQTLSPTVTALSGYEIPIFFIYTNTGHVMLMAAAYLVIHRSSISLPGRLAIAMLIIMFVIAMFQSRSNYAQIVALLMFFLCYHRAAFGRMSFALLTAALLFLLFQTVGFQVTGRIGQVASLDFLGRHIASMIGIEGIGVDGAARGFWQRIDWWTIIVRQVTADMWTFFFGLGFGTPLIEFVNIQSVVVREPHNSYLSVFARMGAFGCGAFLWMHWTLLRVWFRAYTICRRANFLVDRDRLLTLMSYFVLVWVAALAQDAFEKPFFSIPYYFLWGVVVHYAWHLTRSRPAAESEIAPALSTRETLPSFPGQAPSVSR